MIGHESNSGMGGARRLLKGVLPGLVILAAGIAIGAGAMHMAVAGRENLQRQEPEVFAERMLMQMNRELGLTPPQRRQLEPVLQGHYQRLRDIRAEARPRIVAQLEEMDRDISLVLDDDQNELWQQKMDSLEEHFPGFGHRRRGQGRGFGIESDQRGPHGPREPLGEGLRRGQRSYMADVDEPNAVSKE